MINFDAVDFSERRPEEVMFLLMLSVCQNYFCPSWCSLRSRMTFARAFTTKQQVMHAHCIVYYERNFELDVYGYF